MPDIGKMHLSQELECFSARSTVRAKTCERFAAPIFSTAWALMPKKPSLSEAMKTGMQDEYGAGFHGCPMPPS